MENRGERRTKGESAEREGTCVKDANKKTNKREVDKAQLQGEQRRRGKKRKLRGVDGERYKLQKKALDEEFKLWEPRR